MTTKFALNLSYDRTYVLTAKDATTIMDILGDAVMVRPVYSHEGRDEGDQRSHRVERGDRPRMELTVISGEPISEAEWREIEARRKAKEEADAIEA